MLVLPGRFSRCGLATIMAAFAACSDAGSTEPAPAPDGGKGAALEAGASPSDASVDVRGEPDDAGGGGDVDASKAEAGAGADADAGPPRFAHPGVLLGQAELAFVKSKLAGNEEPWSTALTTMKKRRFASLSYVAHPAAQLVRDVDAGVATNDNLTDDAIAAYSHALLFTYTGDATYAKKAVAILNGWAKTLKSVAANAQLDAAWASEMLPRSAEILRYTYAPAAGDEALDVPGLSTLFRDVLLPQLAPASPGARYSNGNWELSMADGTINVGVFLDDRAVFDAGIAMWKGRVPAYIYEPTDGATPVPPPGNVYNTSAKLACFWTAAATITETCTLPVGFGYVKGMAQETCRDVVHVTLGLEAMANAAETARLQGVDLFGPEQTRIVDGTELAAELDLVVLANADASGKASVRSDVCGGTVTVGGPTYPSLGFEIAYNHYAGRRGVSMPKTAALLAKLRPTEAALHMAWETLTFVGAP